MIVICNYNMSFATITVTNDWLQMIVFLLVTFASTCRTNATTWGHNSLHDRNIIGRPITKKHVVICSYPIHDYM